MGYMQEAEHLKQPLGVSLVQEWNGRAPHFTKEGGGPKGVSSPGRGQATTDGPCGWRMGVILGTPWDVKGERSPLIRTRQHTAAQWTPPAIRTDKGCGLTASPPDPSPCSRYSSQLQRGRGCGSQMWFILKRVFWEFTEFCFRPAGKMRYWDRSYVKL